MSPLPLGWTLICAVAGAALVNANNVLQNCQFETTDIEYGDDVWIITGQGIMEDVWSGTEIWTVPTTNVISSIAASYPHSQYLRGLRYPSRYAYETTDAFQSFVRNEHTMELLRNVTFGCSDGSSVNVHFKFPILDVNGPPEFSLNASGVITAKLSELGQIINENVPIHVRDLDVADAFNKLEVMTDMPGNFVAEVVTNAEYPGIGKEYKVLLRLNVDNDSIQEGVYNLNLFCTDGTFMVSSPIRINVIE